MTKIELNYQIYAQKNILNINKAKKTKQNSI